MQNIYIYIYILFFFFTKWEERLKSLFDFLAFMNVSFYLHVGIGGGLMAVTS